MISLSTEIFVHIILMENKSVVFYRASKYQGLLTLTKYLLMLQVVSYNMLYYIFEICLSN